MVKTKQSMPPNAFIGRAEKPTEEDLAAVLGRGKMLWDRTIRELSEEAVDGQEWKSYSKKAGWSLLLRRGKRTIVYLSPCSGCFRVAFILGDRALEIARRASFPESVKKILAEAPHYAEGNGVRLEVGESRDVTTVKLLAKIKLEN